jgi:hypothetical protein
MDGDGRFLTMLRARSLDRLVAAGFLRPSTLLQALRRGRLERRRLPLALALSCSGLLVEPLAWCQDLWLCIRWRGVDCPDDPVIVVGHWRSATTYLHQLLAADPAAATARNSLTMAPQVALLLKPLIRPLLKKLMSAHRPIDAVPWSADDPQEDEIGLARLTMDTNMAGMAFPRDYLRHFRHSVLAEGRSLASTLLWFTRLTWLHDGAGKSHLVIKNSAHMARVPMLLRLFPRARYVLLRREPIDSIRSLVQVKQLLADLVGLQSPPDVIRQVEETVWAHEQLLEAFEAHRSLIPEGHLVEIAYNDLITAPLQTLEQLYGDLRLGDWSTAGPAIAQRVEQARSYRAQPVQLDPAAEQHLQALLGGTLTPC